MTASATLNIRLTSDLKEKLGALANRTGRSRSYLATKADQAYVTRELQNTGGIDRGLADVEAKHVVPHGAAMDQLDDIVLAATADKL